jgi:hypothetical protein
LPMQSKPIKITRTQKLLNRIYFVSRRNECHSN